MKNKGFASDNNSGIDPQILASLSKVNIGHEVGYGGDRYTKQAIDQFKEMFGQETDAYFVFNGTGANVLSISTLLQPFHSVICPETAHIIVDECGAPEKVTGCKLIPVSTPDGKLTPGMIKEHLHGFDFEHHSQPKMISISQVTEMGTVYQPYEIKAIADLAHQHEMYLHIDGARLANAAVALDLPFKAFTRDVGADVVSFGGTKNGMLMGEAVLFFNAELSKNAKYLRKQNTQLFSKMRFVSAQFLAYFENELWRKNASHANKMAKMLEKKVRELNVPVTQKVEANGVFAIIDDAVRDRLREKYFFYPWNENKHEVRWMTSYDTTQEEIEDFSNLLKKLLDA